MKEWFYTITQSMLDLGLRGTDLLVFAALYSYVQQGEGCYFSTREKLARRVGVSSLRTVDAALARLVESGLIEKSTVEVKGVQCVAYLAGEAAKDAVGDVQKLRRGGVQKLQGGCANSAPLQSAKIAPMKNKDSKEESKEVSMAAFVPPTYDEVKAYAEHLGYFSLDPDAFLDYYDTTDWRQNDGTPITNWKRAVANWKRRDKERGIDIARPIHKHVNYSDTLTQQWHTK